MKRIVALLLVLVMVLLPGCRKADRWEEAVDRGRSHLLAEEFMEAIEAFKEAIGIDPDRPEAYKLRGDAWLELAKQALEEGEFEDAEDYLDEAEDDYDRAERRDYDDPDELDDLRDEVEILEDRAEAHDVGPGGQNPDGGKPDTKKLYREFFYSLYNDNDFVALADVTGDGTEEMMVVHLEDPDGFEITGHVYTLQNGAVTEIYTNRGSSVHAGGFYGWYLVERDGGYCLGEEGFGMWQGVGILSFTQYIPAGNGNREVVEELLAQGIRRFLCMDEDVCSRTMTVLNENGLTIPGDAQVASFSDTIQMKSAVPPVSALYFDAAELARAACREFINALSDNPFDPKPLLGYKIRLRHSMI